MEENSVMLNVFLDRLSQNVAIFRRHLALWKSKRVLRKAIKPKPKSISGMGKVVKFDKPLSAYPVAQ